MSTIRPRVYAHHSLFRGLLSMVFRVMQSQRMLLEPTFRISIIDIIRKQSTWIMILLLLLLFTRRSQNARVVTVPHAYACIIFILRRGWCARNVWIENKTILLIFGIIVDVWQFIRKSYVNIVRIKYYYNLLELFVSTALMKQNNSRYCALFRVYCVTWT